jgi:prolyl oligopeptidase
MSAATVEYGSPDDPVEGPYLAAYSPYHNVRAGRVYPVMLFVSALSDRIAPPYGPLKMVARLQAEARAQGRLLRNFRPPWRSLPFGAELAGYTAVVTRSRP